MTEAQLEDLVRRVVTVLQSDDATAAPRPSVLVLFTGALLGFDDALRSLEQLTGELDLQYICTPSAEHILDGKRIEALGMRPADRARVAAHDLAIVPTLTVNVVSKLATGIGDCLASNVLSEFVMSGKPVVAARNGVCPDSTDKQGWYPTMPAAYAQLLRDHLARLTAFGVSLPPASELAGAVRARLNLEHPHEADRSPARLVTEQTVRNTSAGSTILLAQGAIVTDLAWETAAERNITLATNAMEGQA